MWGSKPLRCWDMKLITRKNLAIDTKDFNTIYMLYPYQKKTRVQYALHEQSNQMPNNVLLYQTTTKRM